jgi:ketosteroid isomerase-like protein
MKTQILLAASAAAALLISTQPATSGDGKHGGPTGAFTYSHHPDVAAEQKQVKGVVERYQDGLNTSDFTKIRPLFTPDAVAEWNDKATVIGVEAMARPYEDLFKEIKFNTDFQYDAVDVYGDVAIVRTHHPVGQTEHLIKDGSKKLDFNREIFVLHRVGTEWKIMLYTFNTQPRQGEQ